VPNAGYEVLFTTNAQKVEREIKSLHRQVGMPIVPKVEREIKSLHRQVGMPIIPTVDLSELKALNAELDLKQRHLRQTIAYFKQNQIKASMDLSMPALTPAALQKALPSAEIKKVAQQQAKQLQDAFRSVGGQSAVIDVEIKDLSPASIEVVRKRLVQLTQLTKRRRTELEQMAAVAQEKGIALPSLQGVAKPTIKQFQQALTQGFQEAGDDALIGFVNSLAAGNTKAGKAAAGLGAAVLRELKQVLRIQSPSKETEEDGRNVVDGLTLGISRQADKAVQAARNLAKEVAAAMDPANIPQGPRRQAAAAAMRTPDLSGSWFSQPAPPRQIADPWADAPLSRREREAQMRAQLKAIGIVHLEQKALDDLAASYNRVTNAKANTATAGNQGIAGLLPAAGQSSASRMISDGLAGTFLRAPDISKLKADAKKIEGSNRSLLELGDRLAATTMRPGYYRRAIRRVGIENLPVDIVGAANERSEKPVEAMVRRIIGQKGELERALDQAFKSPGKAIANNGAKAGKDFAEKLADGINSGVANVVAAARRLSGRLNTAAGGSGAGGTGGGTGGRGGGGGGQGPQGPGDSDLPFLPGRRLGDVRVSGRRIKGLYSELQQIDRLINKTPITDDLFSRLQARAGVTQGQIERAQNIGQVQRLRTSSEFFEEGSLIRVNKALQALQIEASEIKPNTKEWNEYQKQIAALGRHLEKTGESARLISLNELSKSVPQASLTALSSKLEALRLQVKDLEPNTEPWRRIQNQINQTTLALERANRAEQRSMLMAREQSAPEGSVAQLQARIARRQMVLERLSPDTAKYSGFSRKIQQDELRVERITRKPLTMGERSGAAAGAVLYGGGLAGSPLSAVGGLAGGLAGGIPGSFTGAAIGQTADQLVAAASASATYAASLSRLRIALAGVSGSLENYQANLKAINSISNTFGMSLDKVIQPYTKLQASVLAAGYSAQTTKEIFEGVTAASIATGGSAEDLEGSMRAVTQIFAKGTVQSEELVGQLSERIPGAFALFAKFNNMSTASLKEALERGQVGLDNFIKFNKGLLETYGRSAREIAKGPEYAGQRLEAALKRLQASVGAALAPTGAAFQDWAAGVVDAFERVIKKAQEYKLLSSQLSPGGIVEEILIGKRTEQSLLDDIKKARAQLKAMKEELKATTPGLSYGPFGVIKSPYDVKKNEVTEKEKQLTTLSAAEAMLRRQEELTRNEAKEQVIAAAEERKKQFASLAQSYGELMSQRDKDLAQTRKDHENDLQELRKNHAKEMLDFEDTLAEERRSTELEIARTRRSIENDAYDIAAQEQILLAKARGEDTAVMEKEQTFRQRVRADREAVLQLEESQITKQENRQKALDKMRKQNAEEINQRAEAHAKRIKSIGEEYAKNVSKFLTKAAVDSGQTLEKTTQRITLQHIMLLMATQRVQGGLHPYKDASGKIADEIQRLQNKIDELGGDFKAFRSPAPSDTSPKQLGQGGPDMPDWVIAQAQNKPVPESSKLYPADNRQYTPHPYAIAGRDASGRLIIGPRPGATPPTPGMEQTRATDAQQLQNEKESRTSARTKDLMQRYNDLLEPLVQAKKTTGEQNDLIDIQADLLHRGVNPALIESLSISMQQGRQAREGIRQEQEDYAKKLAKGDLDQQQYGELMQLASKLNETLKETLALSDQEIAKNKQIGVALRTNLDIAQRSALLRAAPGLQTKTAELMLEGMWDSGKASRFAKVLMNLEGNERIKAQFTNLGETLNSTLGNAIVNVTADWGNFSEALQDSAKTLQDAFKQLANAIINEMTRALVNKAVGWLMRVAGFGAPLVGEGLRGDTGIDFSQFMPRGDTGIDFSQFMPRGDTGIDLSQFIPGGDTGIDFSQFIPGGDTGIDFSQFMLDNQKAFKFANGGIVTGPTLGLIGEGRYNEAIIPMPNNRAVPVDLKGSVGGNYSTSIAVNVNNSSTGATAESQITGDQGNKLAGVLDKAVKQAILSEQRPGGLLYRQ
jgi:tape measure domain-containing protein